MSIDSTLSLSLTLSSKQFSLTVGVVYSLGIILLLEHTFRHPFRVQPRAKLSSALVTSLPELPHYEC